MSPGSLVFSRVPPLSQVLFGCSLLVLASLPAGALDLRFADASVEVAGVTPGGELALLTVWREMSAGGSEVTVRDELLLDEDGDGIVVLDLGRPIPPLSVWVVADVTSGDVGIQAPEGFEPRRRPVRPGRLVGEGAALRAELDLPRAEVLWVRPGEGAYRAWLGDGDSGDLDGEPNGRVALAATGLERGVRRPPQAAEPALPSGFQPGDALVAVDPRTLETVALQVPEGPP